MAVPGFQEFMLPVLQVAAEHPTLHKSEYDQIISDRVGLTEEDKEEMLSSGNQTTYQNRIGWAITYFVKAKLLERPARATIQITERGRELLGRNPERITSSMLKAYPEFQEFQTATKTGKEDEPENETDEVSPSEQLDKAYTRLRKTLASDLIDLIKEGPPDFFERLVVEVLVSMGYGGTIQDAGQALGKSGDGGIDGVIKEDRLGLDSIYIQAKRWESSVGRPEIQAFAGALMGLNATRGVFITSSDFTSGAREYVKALQTKIVLINGQELAELMIEYGVGVIDEQTYRVKRVDPEYFGE